MLGSLSPPEIEALLDHEVIGRIGCHADNRTYVVPITYAWRDGCVYAHSAEGQKIRMMRANPHVCFEVDQMDDLATWKSVIADGTYEELHGDDASHGMQVLLDRLMPLMISATARPTHGTEPRPSHGGDTAGMTPVLYRIRLTNLTGRFERRT